MSEKEGLRHLFVYGTLRPGGGAPPRVRRTLEEGADHVGAARVRGRLLVAGGGSYPALVRTDGPGRVVGDLYRLRFPRRVLESLDRYEGRRPDGTGLYRRETVPVRLPDAPSGGEGEGSGGRRLRAWTYIYNRDTAGLDEVEGNDWLRR
mgnify:CR=1 FL=1